MAAKKTARSKSESKSAATSEATSAAKSEPTPEAGAPLNREQRRAQKFGKAGKVHEHVPGDPWPESGSNPAFGRGGDDQAAYAGRPDQDVTRETGPGTGGATEQKGQRPQHEGAHAGQSTKG